MNRLFYRLIPEGFAESQIKAFHEERLSVQTEWFEFTKKHGATKAFIGDRLNGILLAADKVPIGWASNRDLPEGCYKPTRRKACMEAYKEFTELKGMPSGMQLSKRLGVDAVFTGLKICFPTFEKLGEEIILSLKEGSDVPEGTISPPLKMSEYWALKEEVADTAN